VRQVLLGLTSPPETIPIFGVSAPRDWGDPDRETEAIVSQAAVVPAPWERILQVKGREAGEFLQAMLTQDVARLDAGACVPAALADRKGHFVADLWVLRADSWYIRVRSDRMAAVMGVFEQHRIAEDVRWREVDYARHLLLVGPDAARFMDGAVEAAGRQGTPIHGTVLADGSLWMRVRETRFSPCPGDGQDEFLLAFTTGTPAVVAPASGAPVPWSAVNWTDLATLPLAGWTAFNAARIRSGVPWHGLDGGEERLVPEVVPDDRISYEKGCYLGQETIARLRYQGKMNWKIQRVEIEGGVDATETYDRHDRSSGHGVRTAAAGDPAARAPMVAGVRAAEPSDSGDLLNDKGQRVGWLTSAARTLQGPAPALAFLHRSWRESPGGLRLASGATVSWVGEL